MHDAKCARYFHVEAVKIIYIVTHRRMNRLFDKNIKRQAEGMIIAGPGLITVVGGEGGLPKYFYWTYPAN